MQFSVLASGSKGNVTFVSSSHAKILVDVGMTTSYVEKSLQNIGVHPSEIGAILLTHTHVDHIHGLKVFLKKYHPILFVTEKMLEDLQEQMVIPHYQIITSDFVFEDIEISCFKTSHDVSDSNGYILKCAGKSLVYVTDTGYINLKNYNRLRNHNYYIIESNHDITMLMNGRYPYHLKQRILGDRGHLSNKDSAYYLSEFIGENTEGVVLIHLSEENNTEEIAFTTLEETLRIRRKNLDHIIISKQQEPTELIEL